MSFQSQPEKNMNGVGAILIGTWTLYMVVKYAVAAGIYLADKLKKK